MDFRLEYSPKQFPEQINHYDRLLLIGSCFTENIGSKLKQLKFSVLENPHGILFNPASIVTALDGYIGNRQYSAHELFYQNESWHSWDHHSRFSHPDLQICLSQINQSQKLAHEFLSKADWLMITVGSAFVYKLNATNFHQENTTRVVANCHKVPTDKFTKCLLQPEEIFEMLHKVLLKLYDFNPGVKVIFTISPVRHLRDGFVENNRSKSALIQAIHKLVDEDKRLNYFPAYELVIDDLRDYRFFAEDMVHPNYSATNYVWEKFQLACVSESARLLMKSIAQLNAARSHKPFNAGSNQHKQFLQSNLSKALQLKTAHSWLNLDDEIDYFSNV